MSRKRLQSLLALLLVFSLIVVGCASNKDGNSGSSGGDSGSQSGGSSGGSKKTIRILSSETNQYAVDYLNEAVKAYEEETGIHAEIEVVPTEDSFAKISSTMNSSSHYDVFITGYLGHVALLAEQDMIVPVDDVIEKIGGREDFAEQILAPIDGKIYWIPYDYNLAFGYIRKDWLEEKGLSVPKTWAELEHVAKELTDKEKGRYGIIMPLKSDGSPNWLSTGMLWANDVHFFDENWNVILDSPEMKPKVVEALNHLKTLYQYMPPGVENKSYADELASFTSGESAIAFYGGRLTDLIEDKYPELSDKFEVFPYPSPDGSKFATTFGYAGMVAIKSEQTDEAKKFLEWFYKNKLIGFLHTVPVHFFPAQESVYNNEEWRSHPSIQKYWDVAVEPQYYFKHNAIINSVDTDGPYFDIRAGHLFESNLVAKMYQKVCLLNEDPEKVVDEIAQEIRDLLKDYN